MSEIKQFKEFDIKINQCPDDKDSIILIQCDSKVYVEKRNIKLLMAQLILLDK